MRVLAITSLFPHAADPQSAPFNRQQLAALGELCELEVWGTLPWFPGKRVFVPGERGRTLIPTHERIDGLPVMHPRTPYIPRVGHALSVPLYAGALARPMWRRRDQVDVILGSWAYPDGAAAIALGGLIRAPVVVKLHGSDINVVAARRAPQAILKRMLPRAGGIVAVSRPLAQRAEELGVPRERIHVVYNGIDRSRFRPQVRTEARNRLGLQDNVRWLVYCGHLKRTKGIEDLMNAFVRMSRHHPDVRLAVVGDGPDRAACDRAAASVPGRILLVGPQPHAAIPEWMAACDALVLPSWNEGTPNVVLEALSCGRRVVATDAGGTADLVTSHLLGELVPPRAPAALAEALARAASTPYDPDEVAAAAPAGDWRESAGALHRVLVAALDRRRRRSELGAPERVDEARAPLRAPAPGDRVRSHG